MRAADLRAARANRVFRADEKRIRTKNTVMDESNHGLGCFYKRSPIARGRAAVRASSQDDLIR
jgi:hypothetical protein